MSRRTRYDHLGHQDKVFDRPGRRSRPRTKHRPDYSSLPVGRVITVDRGRYRTQIDDRLVSATKARGLGRGSVIVGDEVRVDGDTSGDPGTLARIVEVLPRRSVLRRTADDNDPYERPIVANADQLMVVVALADPPPREGMIDRVLVAAYDAKVEPILCLTKSDLASPESLQAEYEPLEVPIVVTEPGSDLTQLREILRDRITVFIGHSGVGKSTLINALIPDANRSTGEVNDVTGRGRHTSTSAIALELPGGGWAIDTPGVRSFGLSHVTDESLIEAFPDVFDATRNCPRGCTHLVEEPECGLDNALRHGILSDQRIEGLRRILEARHSYRDW